MRGLVSDVSSISTEAPIGSDSCTSGSSDSGATVGDVNVSTLLADYSEAWGEVGNSGSAEEFLEDGGGVGAAILLRPLKDSHTETPY